MDIDSPNALYVHLPAIAHLSNSNWLSCCTLDYCKAVNSFVCLHTDLWPNLLSDKEWHSIDLIATWLKTFHSATTQMLATKKPMLSTMHAVFLWPSRSPSEYHLKPTSFNTAKSKERAHRCSLQVKRLLLYLWWITILSLVFSSVNWYNHPYFLKILIHLCAVLDPQISYAALKEEFDDDNNLSSYLENTKSKLQSYFKQKYPAPSLQPTSISPAPSLSSISFPSMSTISSASGSPQKNFTTRFQHKCTSPNELLEFWSLPQEDFDIIDPLQWWLGRRAQFPQLYCLAHDIFSIPGMKLYSISFGSS